TLARALRDIEFRYLGLDRRIEAFRPGGRIVFREMPNRTVLIDQWSLRLISTEYDTIQVGGQEQIRTRFHATEAGGELARAKWPNGTSWRGSLGGVRIAARTSANAPSPGTIVHLPDTPYFGVADNNGSIEISDFLPGPYSVAIVDARLATLGLEIPTALNF